MFPSILEYNQTLITKGSSAFKTLSNLSFIPSRTVPIKIYIYGSGSYAVVFKAENGFNKYAIRCFLNADNENFERYKLIDLYLRNQNASWLTKFEFLENEIYVGSRYFPVIKMDWINGVLLNDFIASIINDNTALNELQKEIVNVSKSLEELRIGHGDIQCGNIIVSNFNGKAFIKLIDYDGMYVPSLSSKYNLERGRSEFQHPNRTQINFDEKIDRFSFWVILCAIEALKFDKSLWLEVMQGGFNTLDNLLFIAEDFQNFNHSRLVQKLYGLNQDSLNFYLNNLKLFCSSSPNSVLPPQHFEFYKESDVDVKKHTELVTLNKSFQIKSDPDGAVVLTQLLQKIGTTPITLSLTDYLGKKIIVSYSNQTESILVSSDTTDTTIYFTQHVSQAKLPYIQDIKDQEDTDTVKEENSLDKPESKTYDTQVINAPEKHDYTWTVLGILSAIILVGIIVTIFASHKELLSFQSSSSTGKTASATYPSLESLTVDTTLSVLVDTALVKTESSETTHQPSVSDNLPDDQIEKEVTDSKDDYGNSSEDVALEFFKILQEQECTKAWNMTFNPEWEKLGLIWFCSLEKFGGIISIKVISFYPISQKKESASFKFTYYCNHLSNGRKCYVQRINLEKLKLINDQLLWVVTGLDDLREPYDCDM